MSDPDYPPIETTGGDRPGNSLAERSVVVLAALALVAGGLIALGNLTGKDKELAKASPTPAPHRTPRPTPVPSAVPTPTPPEVVLLAGIPPSSAPSQQPRPFSGWIRALADQSTWPLASAGGTRIGVFSKGQIAYGNEEPISPGWLNIQDSSGQSSYVQIADGGKRLVEEITPDPVLVSGDIASLAAGPKGLVAIVNPPALSDRTARSFAVYSVDGAAWQRVDLPPYVSTVAWGPAGWLAMGSIDDQDSSTTWVFSSSDGLQWTSLGAATGTAAGAEAGLQYPGQLLGSSSGYLLQTYGRNQHLWFSTDGLTWVDSTGPNVTGLAGGERHLAALESGFLAWVDGGPPPGRAQLSYWGGGGVGWRPMPDAPSGVNMSFTSFGDQVIAAVTDPENQSVSFRTGTFHRGELIWTAPSQFVPRAGVAEVVSDARKVTALLWDRGTDRINEWSSTDGHHWQLSPLPEGTFGGIPRLVAGGPGGVVAVGYRLTMRGANPVFWREVSPGGWTSEPLPMLPVVPDPKPNACAPAPSDFVSFTVLDRAIAIGCFGSAPLTFSAWSAACDGCYGESSGYDPAWLASPARNQLFLNPLAQDGGGQQVVVSPTLKMDPAWTAHWIEVTGHFDDPAAATCRYTPSPADDAYYSGQYWTVVSCRQQFVVTAVRLVNPP